MFCRRVHRRRRSAAGAALPLRRARLPSSSWCPAGYLVSQWFADQGFAVVVADGRGTPGRGRRGSTRSTATRPASPWRTRWTRCRRPLRRTPTSTSTGWRSAAGRTAAYLAALTVLRRPDVFHAAVAGAPVTDPRLYDTHWQERYLGHPEEYPEVTPRPSRRRGQPVPPLMLVHGLADDNVRPRPGARRAALDRVGRARRAARSCAGCSAPCGRSRRRAGAPAAGPRPARRARRAAARRRPRGRVEARGREDAGRRCPRASTCRPTGSCRRRSRTRCATRARRRAEVTVRSPPGCSSSTSSTTAAAAPAPAADGRRRDRGDARARRDARRHARRRAAARGRLPRARPAARWRQRA